MIYLDHHAAAPVCGAALDAMDRVRAEGWANPSSTHAAGRQARKFVEEAREALAAVLDARPADLVWTGGGTEACNLGVFGLLAGRQHPRVVTTSVEHPAVSAAIERSGARVQTLASEDGIPPSPDELGRALEELVDLVAVSWVNHETGTVFPIEQYADVCAMAGVPLFIDACQALGKLPISVERPGLSAIAVASSKVGGPAGAGALWIERGFDLPPWLAGGAQERGRRPGSPDVAAIAGFGAALAELDARLAAMPAIAERRDRLEAACVELGARPNAGRGPRASTVSNVSFRNWKGPELVAALDLEGLCASSGAACSAGDGLMG